MDFGSLSARNVVTANDGKATFVYTAPAPVAGFEGVDLQTVVNIHATPTGTDFGNSLPRVVSIRLLPIGIVRPPNGSPTAEFTVSPATASEGVDLHFDGSASTDDGRIVTYAWFFGDGDTDTGVTVNKSYSAPGLYSVTLRVTDDRGMTGATTKQVSIGTASDPTAAFTVSPTPAAPGGNTFFDGSLSAAAPGRRIVSYNWTFGDGESGSGASTTHVFASTGTFAVTLTVTDDIGKTGVTSQTVTVISGSGNNPDPVASFTTSPGSPSVNGTVFFNGSGSTAPAGRTITSYRWDFGDGATATGVSTTHAYTAGGTYTVSLTVTDSSGKTNTATRSVTITGAAPSDPVARLTISPSTAVINSPVQANASTSTGGSGQTIVCITSTSGTGHRPRLCPAPVRPRRTRTRQRAPIKSR